MAKPNLAQMRTIVQQTRGNFVAKSASVSIPEDPARRPAPEAPSDAAKDSDPKSIGVPADAKKEAPTAVTATEGLPAGAAPQTIGGLGQGEVPAVKVVSGVEKVATTVADIAKDLLSKKATEDAGTGKAIDKVPEIKDPTKKEAPEAPSNKEKGSDPESTGLPKGSDTDSEAEKVAASLTPEGLRALIPLTKIAEAIMETDEGRRFVDRELRRHKGEKIASEMIQKAAAASEEFIRDQHVKAAAYNEALERKAAFEDFCKSAAAEYGEDGLQELLKTAHEIEIATQDMSEMEKAAFAAGMEDAGAAADQMQGEDPATATIPGAETEAPGPEELLMAAQEALQNGEITEEEYQQIVEVISQGAAPEGDPAAAGAAPEGAAPEGDVKSASANTLVFVNDIVNSL